MTKKQKFILDGLVNQWNDILMEWVASGKTDMNLKKKLDVASKLCDDYEKEIGLTDDDYFNLMIK
jgi:hypothetical protein